ncbi:MAG: int, tyrosine-based site-specific recombinase, partial [Pseudomonadota bacterium]|nr:int, tyrosine-based site-specific recombinase [Pseudomonadota bacterium]
MSPEPRRKLHVGHFALMRAVVQGIDVKASWERYLRLEGDPSDQRLVRSTIAWIRDAFAAAARREDRFGTARLVRLDASRIAEPAPELPSLEEFAEEAGLVDYSEAEQIAAFEAKYGSATARQKRRARLVERQLEAIAWLQALVAQPPRAGDAVASWLNPALVAHLH